MDQGNSSAMLSLSAVASLAFEGLLASLNGFHARNRSGVRGMSH